MPRPTRAQKDRRNAREEEALKASETSITTTTTTIITTTTPPALNCGSCCTNSDLGSAGGEARVLAAGENKQENATEITASKVVQDKRPERRTAEIDKERSDGGERGLGENKHEKMSGINGSEAMQDKGAGKRMAEIEKKRSDGGERGLGENKHEKMTDIDGSEAMRDKGAGKRMAEIEKKRSDGGERGPSRKGGEEEAVSLRPSQFDSRQKQRDEGSSFAGSKGSRQDYNSRNSSVSQSYEAENSRKGSNQGYYQNRWRGRGGDDGGDSRRIDALGRALGCTLGGMQPMSIPLVPEVPITRPVREVGRRGVHTSRSCRLGALEEEIDDSSDEDYDPNEEECDEGDVEVLEDVEEIALEATPPRHVHGLLSKLSEEDMRRSDPSWQPGDPRTADGWRELFRNASLDALLSSTGRSREILSVDAHLPSSAGRHTDILAPTYHTGQDVATQRARISVLEAENALLREMANLRVWQQT